MLPDKALKSWLYIHRRYFFLFTFVGFQYFTTDTFLHSEAFYI